MTDHYKVTTEEVRNHYIEIWNPDPMDEEIGKEFDRWLADHDAQVLRDAALSGDFGTTAQSALLARAERIAGGSE